MTLPPSFYRTAAAASLLSALTTLALIFLPHLYEPADDFDGRMRRVLDTAYQLRSWIYLIHPLLAWTAAAAVALRLRRRAAGPALLALAGFSLWAVTELTQQALTLVAFDPWRLAWVAGDPQVRATMAIRTALYDGLWDALYVLLLIGFVAGSALMAAAMRGRSRLTRAVALLYAAAALLGLSMLSRELGGPALPPRLEAWLYPAIQPLARVGIALWLWRFADEGGRTSPYMAARPRP